MPSNWKWVEPEIKIEATVANHRILTNKIPLNDYPKNIAVWLRQNAGRFPDKPFLQERGPDGGWVGLTYAAALTAVNQISNGLLNLHLPPDAPVAILSENCINLALIQLAAMQIGHPAAPISLAYSVRSQTGTHIKHILDVTQAPILIMSNAEWHMPKLRQWDLSRVQLFAFSNAGKFDAVRPFTDLSTPQTNLSDEGELHFTAVTANTLAKIQFTSGSTDLPKGVMVTHGMMASNQIGIRQVWPFLDSDEVVVDWLPWNHTFGGNFVFNMMLMLGGTFYIDNGNPTPAGFAKSIQNIKNISPTMYMGVPRSYTALYNQMKTDSELRQAFFKNLKFIFTAAAALDQTTYEGMKEMSRDVLGTVVPFFSAWGCTETSPCATLVYGEIEDARVIGLPIPGVEVKLAADKSGKEELRVRGPNVTAGYYNNTLATELAFDEEGYYRTGDAGQFLDADDPEAGLIFDGRIGEDFKLTSGVWVHNIGLRISVNQLGQPYLLDMVVAAPNKAYLTALVYPNIPALRQQFPQLDHLEDDVFLGDTAVIRLFQNIFRQHNNQKSGSSKRFERFALLPEAPQIDRNETTDKGYINQSAVLNSHVNLVTALYADPIPEGIYAVDNERP
ncbi:MAG: AMP-binding protein [Chloroflexi bacterium]|nr:AMP-binding protein [Chloroflexota bacterium]